MIIAGFGRFGQIVGRMLFANGIRAVVLDHDPDQIEMLRRFGYQVFYGDATRLDLLRRRARARRALLVNAIDDVDDEPRARRPRARATSRTLRDRRARAQRLALLRAAAARREVIERETFESVAARRAGARSRRWASTRSARARWPTPSAATTWPRSGGDRCPHYQDETRMLSVAKAGREELERLFAKDRERFEREQGGGEGWR